MPSPDVILVFYGSDTVTPKRGSKVRQNTFDLRCRRDHHQRTINLLIVSGPISAKIFGKLVSGFEHITPL